MKAVEGKHAYAGAVPEYSWVEALQNFWLRRVDVSRHLVRAIDLSAPEGLVSWMPRPWGSWSTPRS